MIKSSFSFASKPKTKSIFRLRYYLLYWWLYCIVPSVFADGLQNIAPPPQHVNWFNVDTISTTSVYNSSNSNHSSSLNNSNANTVNAASVSNPDQFGDSFFHSTPLPESSLLAPVSLEEVQVGNSFFESANATTVSIRQIGATYEDRINMSDFYLYFNQLLENNVFYEIRLYMAYLYQTTNPGFPQVPASNQPNPPGYGSVGILGYVIFLNSNVSLMPFVRLGYYDNFYMVYSNSDGSYINSSQYVGQGGARLSLKVNNAFAIYTSYYAGYQIIYLSGGGKYANSDNPQIAGLASCMEIGTPYRMTKSLSVTPSVFYNINANNPNYAASTLPYNAITTTLNSTTFAIRLSYDF